MAHALELRSPFLDTALIEYAALLPRQYLRTWLKGKRVLKAAFNDLLPEAISERKKMGFAVPLGTWFRGDLKAYLHDYLGPRARVCEYVEPQVLSGLLESHQRGAADHGQRLWLLLTLEIWLRGLV
jgi:asparagine synthase (glutamine-hydrolysing)